MGAPADWGLRRPAWRPISVGPHWLGPLAVAASVASPWAAFSGAGGDEGNVAFGLFVGAASITLMAWSFVLALRARVLESLFGGLDSMYRMHRWCGTLSVLAMYLHTSAEPEIEGGIAGASRSLAGSARDLAGVGEILLYILVAISLVRWFPYRYWRWTHKFLGVPFVFASFHFFTAEKPYANRSAWGLYFGGVMLAGIAAYVARVVGRDIIDRGHRHRVVAARRHNATTELVLEPVGLPMRFTAGQFAVVKLRRRGLTEPHVFTIASSPDDRFVRFFIRDLGDWTHRVHEADLVGIEADIEGPYGRFDPVGTGEQQLYWIAGGVGITPFLSVIDSLEPLPEPDRPNLLYCVGSREEAMAADRLVAAADEGRIRLHWFESASGKRFSESGLGEVVGSRSLSEAHVAVCGPSGLVDSAVRASVRLGARSIETEDFDLRGGFGPDLSLTVEEALGRI